VSIVASPPPRSIATRIALQLDIYVDSAAWEGAFDSLEVWRSRNVRGAGPYTALTGEGWARASLPAHAVAPSPSQTGPSLTLSSKVLNLLVGEKTAIAITFTGSDPLTLHTAAGQIITQGNGLLASFVLDGQLYIQTTQPGSSAILRVVGGSAAPLLGLSIIEPGSLSFGVDARIPLVHNVQNYLLTDVNGSRDYWYKTRFFDSSSDTSSEFSIPFQGRLVSDIGPQNVIRATVDLVATNGAPAVGQAVLLFNRFDGTRVSGKTVVGGTMNVLTDENGHAEFILVRGSKVTVALAGTSLVRDVTVPTDALVQSFDLFDPALGSNDLFDVQVPNIEFASRRSL
jgi:hypothetical protein